MAKPARGLPTDFSLSLPDDQPVVIGDFLEEEPFAISPPRRIQAAVVPKVERPLPVEHQLRPEIAPERPAPQRREPPPRPLPAAPRQASVIRYQLNLSPKSKSMLEELVEYVCTYSPENDARTSEVFQGIIGLLHGAMDELELANVPRRGAWGSVTAKNFPGALGEAFEQAILKAARKRGVSP